MLKRILSIFIILLFAGVSYSSAISIDTKSITSIEEKEDDFGCDVFYMKDFAIINELLNRLELIINLIKLRFSLIPNIVEKSNEILELIDSDSPFCIFLDNIFESLIDIYIPLYELKDAFSGNPIFYYICVYSAGFLFIIIYNIYIIGMVFCDWYPYYPPLI